ncbi:hypothetical protein Tco_1304006 [Tanacetum coccineum]
MEVSFIMKELEVKSRLSIVITAYVAWLHLRMEERSSYTKIVEVRMKTSQCDEGCSKAIERIAKEYQVRSMGLVVVVLD